MDLITKNKITEVLADTATIFILDNYILKDGLAFKKSKKSKKTKENVELSKKTPVMFSSIYYTFIEIVMPKLQQMLVEQFVVGETGDEQKKDKQVFVIDLIYNIKTNAAYKYGFDLLVYSAICLAMSRRIHMGEFLKLSTIEFGINYVVEGVIPDISTALEPMF